MRSSSRHPRGLLSLSRTRLARWWPRSPQPRTAWQCRISFSSNQALYDLARGEHAIEAHIEAMTTARKLAHEGDLYGYWQIISPLMFEDAASPDRWVRERVVAERFAALPVPWKHAVTVATFAQTPTLVVTGGWNDE